MDYINTFIAQNAGPVDDEDRSYIQGCYNYYLNEHQPALSAAQNAMLDWEENEEPCYGEDADDGNGPSGGDGGGVYLGGDGGGDGWTPPPLASMLQRATAVSSYLPSGISPETAVLADVVQAENLKDVLDDTIKNFDGSKQVLPRRAIKVRNYLPSGVPILNATRQQVQDAEIAYLSTVDPKPPLIMSYMANIRSRATSLSSYLPSGITPATASLSQVKSVETALRTSLTSGSLGTAVGPYSLNWIRINTSEREPATPADNDTSISMLSVYTYKPAECNKIKDCLKDPRERGGDNPITFTNDGHIALDFLNNNRAQLFYPNPVIKPPLRTGSLGGRYTTWMQVPDSEKPLGRSIAVDRKVETDAYGKVFFYGADFLFSENLKWILYKLPGYYYKRQASAAVETAVLSQDGTARNGEVVFPVYVLLYNPIHRRNFRELYKEMIKGTGSSAPTNPFRNTGNDFGYMETMKKYCNAFIVSSGRSGPNSNHTLRHYGDPSCAISLNRHNAKLSSIIKWNLTDDTIRNKYYNDRTVGGVSTPGYPAAISAVSVKLPDRIPYCPSIGGGNPSMFLKNAAQLLGRAVTDGADASESTSFIQILANHVIAGSAGGTESFTAAQLNGGTGGANGNGGRAIQCPNQNITNVTCETNINIGDAGQMTNNDISASCGNEVAPEAVAQSQRTLEAQCCLQQLGELYPNVDVTTITQVQLEAIQAAFNSADNAENRAAIALRDRADAVLNYLPVTRRLTRIPPYTEAEVTAAEAQSLLDPNNPANQTPAQAPPAQAPSAADGASDTLYIYFAIIVAILIAVIFGMYFILK